MVDKYPGYSPSELDRAEDMYGIVFPPDLRAMLSERHKLLHYDWRTDNQRLREAFAQPYEGLLFDIENNVFWPLDWGERPDGPEARGEVLRSILANAPKLIPLYGHRYLPATPCEAGNPVFSVVQADIVYYGIDLEDYVEREISNGRTDFGFQELRQIPFWSAFAEGDPYDECFRTDTTA